MRHLWTILASALVLPVGWAHAQTDWARQLAGLDGVAIACVSSTGEGYAKRICDTLSDNARSVLEAAGVRVAVSGYYREGGPAPDMPQGMERPLWITLYLRGTAGDRIAILVRGRASVAYTAAVEAGSGSAGRSGDLVMWEQSTVGSGPAGQLEPAIANAMSVKIDGLLAHVVKGWE